MIKTLNLGNKKESIEALNTFKEKIGIARYIRIINSNIRDLNKVIGRNVFKKDALYINSQSLWEIMQPAGGRGAHNYHGLTPEQVYDALSRLQYAKDVFTSYRDRYIVITDVVFIGDVYLIVIVTPESDVPSQKLKNIITIITIYPSDKDWRKNKK